MVFYATYTPPKLGEKKFTCQTEEGVDKRITAQVADVNKALLSARKIVVARKRVVYDDQSYIEFVGCWMAWTGSSEPRMQDARVVNPPRFAAGSYRHCKLRVF